MILAESSSVFSQLDIAVVCPKQLIAFIFTRGESTINDKPLSSKNIHVSMMKILIMV